MIRADAAGGDARFTGLEVPIVFRDRRAGASKMSGAIVLEAAWRVPLLRWDGTSHPRSSA
jgi:hypothetical protein